MSGKGSYRYKDTRKVLDQLLGEDRNGENDATARKLYSDEAFCRAFLCGMCPHEMFLNTKNDMGDCPRRHNEKKRRDYEEAVANGTEPGYDQELYWILRRVVDDCNRRVHRGQQRLLETQGPEDEDAISVQIKDMMARVEQLGEAGDVDASVALLDEVNKLKEAKLRDEKMRKAAEGVPDGAVPTQRLRVCESCASFLSLSDNEKRLSDHYTGKLHQSFVIIRRKLEQLEKDRPKWQNNDPRAHHGGPGGGGGFHGGGGGGGGGHGGHFNNGPPGGGHFHQGFRGGGGGGGGGFRGGGGGGFRGGRRDYDRSRDGPRDYTRGPGGPGGGGPGGPGGGGGDDHRERRRSRSPRRDN